jgi:hypothetical protein
MGWFKDGRHRWVILLPLAVLALCAVFSERAIMEVEKALLNAKYEDASHLVDMLGAAVEANPGREWDEHESNIRDFIEHADRMEQVFAAAYKVSGGEPVIFTERHAETTSLDPFDYAEFLDAIRAADYGGVTVGFEPEGQEFRDSYLYYRWMPLYSAYPRRYLIVMGVSEYAITSHVAWWVSAGMWACTGVTFLLNMWLTVLIVSSGRRSK